MQALEFAKGLSEIVKELKIDELVTLIHQWLAQQQPGNPPVQDPEKDRFFSLLVDSRSGYDRLLRLEITKKILEGLQAHDLYEPARLRRITMFVSNAGNVSQLRTGNADVSLLFEGLRAFQRIAATSRNLLESEKVGEIPKAEGIIELQLVDYEGQGVEPERLSAVALTLSRLYKDLARLLGVQNDKFTFKYVDSGSDLIFGIQGLKEVVDAAGTLFLKFWDKLLFRRHEKFEKDMEVLSKGLDFMSKTHAAAEQGVISDEEEKILKASVFKRADELIGLGVSLPLKNASIDQRQLLVERRDVKLLGSGDAARAEDKPAGPGGDVARGE